MAFMPMGCDTMGKKADRESERSREIAAVDTKYFHPSPAGRCAVEVYRERSGRAWVNLHDVYLAAALPPLGSDPVAADQQRHEELVGRKVWLLSMDGLGQLLGHAMGDVRVDEAGLLAFAA